MGASCSSWTFPQTQDDRRPAAPSRQHRRLPLRLPHLPHLLAGPAALEEEVRTVVNVNVRRSHAGLRIWGSDHVMAAEPKTSDSESTQVLPC